MTIRGIDKYSVIKRFSIGRKLYDIGEIIFIEAPEESPSSLSVFDMEKKFAAELDPKFLALLNGEFLDLIAE